MTEFRGKRFGNRRRHDLRRIHPLTICIEIRKQRRDPIDRDVAIGANDGRCVLEVDGACRDGRKLPRPSVIGTIDLRRLNGVFGRELGASKNLLDPTHAPESHVAKELHHDARIREHTSVSVYAIVAIAVGKRIRRRVIRGTRIRIGCEHIRIRTTFDKHARRKYGSRIATWLVVDSSASLTHRILPILDHPRGKTRIGKQFINLLLVGRPLIRCPRQRLDLLKSWQVPNEL